MWETLSLLASNLFSPVKQFWTVITSRNLSVETVNSNFQWRKFARFLVVGGVNTVFGFIVYSVCIVNGFSVWLAVLTGTLSGTVFNFFTTGGYVFRQLSLTRFPRFVLCYFFVYTINLILIELVSAYITNKILTQAILTLPLAILSYFLMARFVFDTK
jgi:putative flippase GtrA